MANFFDQFDGAPAIAQGAAPQNFFDQFDEQPKPQGGKQLSEMDRLADERVAKEVAGGLVPKTDSGRYLPFGSFIDEAMAGLDAGLGYVTGGRFGANSYEEAKAYQDARQRYIDQNASGLDKGLAVAGGVALSGGLPALNIFKGATLLPQMGNMAATGGAYAGLYGLGEGEGMERLENAAKGAAVGTATGAVLAPVARGVGNAISYVRDRTAPLQGQLANYDRGAVNRVLEDFTSDGITPQNYAQKSDWLGEPGMLADMGEDMLLTTNALGNTPGPQMSTVRNAVGSRQDVAPDRIRGLLDTNAGAPRDIPAYMRNQKALYQGMAKPYYDQFYATPIKPDDELVSLLQAVPESAWGKVQTIMRAERIDPASVSNNGRGIDLIKRALDDVVAGTQQGTNEHRVYSSLARQITQKVDSLLSPNDPSKSPWALGRKLYGEGAQGREGVEVGRKVFQGQGMRPYDLKEELRGGSAYKQAGVKIGMRDELNSKMGRAATNFGRKGDAAARRALNSEFSRENLEVGVGSIRADRVAKGIDAENAMADTFNEVMSNSATAKRQAAQRRLPMTSDRPLADNTPSTISAWAAAGVKRMVNAATAGALNERAQRIMLDQARMLTARGITRDQIAQEMLNLASQRNLTAAQRANIIASIDRLTRGAPVAASEYASPGQ